MAVSLVADSPGLVVARTVAMIVNEAAEAVQMGICSPADADLAMRLGVNYPRGPLEWGDKLGSGYVLSLLEHLGRLFPDGRYRPSLRLRHSALAGTPLTR
jgi:3-hydroxybutyryl-CoA dehydrogenase